MKTTDVVAHFFAGCAAVLLCATVLACVHTHPCLTQSARGGAWAAQGCIDPRKASPRDWRIVPGVTKRVAEALSAACPLSSCGGQIPAVPGVGPVLRGRLTASLCRSAGPPPRP